MSKVIQDYIGFASLRSVIGPSPNKSDAKLKPITTWWPAFARTLSSLVVFTSSSRLPLKVFCDLTLVLVLRQSIGKSVLLLSNKVYPEKVRMSETINVLKPLTVSHDQSHVMYIPPKSIHHEGVPEQISQFF